MDSSSVYTPPAPLSARGDLPGYVKSIVFFPQWGFIFVAPILPICDNSHIRARALAGDGRCLCYHLLQPVLTDICLPIRSGYFPLHEDQNRVYRSHPFHLDATKARSKSIQRASSQASSVDSPAVSAPPAAQRPTPPPERASVPGAMPSYAPASSAVEATSTALSNMPVASYIPSGVHANPLPMGKYYPSNYENSHSHRPSLPAATVHTDPQVPTYRDTTGHSRNESEAKRRLQQYQRDMIAQATLALNGGNINVAAMSAISLRNLGFTSLPTKPSKPRLAPLGSPGPVTPMNLESGDDGYLGVHLHASEATLPTEEVVRAIRAEEERRRREGGSSSPAVELGRIF